jgi:hypothetical protein
MTQCTMVINYHNFGEKCYLGSQSGYSRTKSVIYYLHRHENRVSGILKESGY